MFKQRNTLLLLFLELSFFIRVDLSFEGLCGQNTYEYLHLTQSLQHYFKTGINASNYF